MHNEDLKVLGMAAAGLITLIALVSWFEAASCRARASEMHLAARWSFMTGCMVQVRGQWVPLGSYRVLD